MQRHAAGAPEGIRIPDLPLRRRTLYPAELRAHLLWPKYFCSKLARISIFILTLAKIWCQAEKKITSNAPHVHIDIGI